jgi:predicted Zn-dependent protease
MNLNNFLNYVILFSLSFMLSGLSLNYSNKLKYGSCEILKTNFNSVVKWNEDKFPIEFSVSESIPKELHQDIISAAQNWNKTLNKNVIIVSFYKKDIENKIEFVSSWEKDKPHEQGRTTASWKGDEIIKAVIKINHENFSFYTQDKKTVKSQTDSTELYNFEALMIHEFGHAIGLNHSNDPESVMITHLSSYSDRTNISNQDVKNFNCAYR